MPVCVCVSQGTANTSHFSPSTIQALSIEPKLFSLSHLLCPAVDQLSICRVSDLVLNLLTLPRDHLHPVCDTGFRPPCEHGQWVWTPNT